MKLLITSKEIREEAKKMAFRISRLSNPILVGVLKGAYPFLRDLSFALKTPHQIDFIIARSYKGTSSTEEVIFDYFPVFKGRNVVVVEDIVDTGLTVREIKKRMEGNFVTVVSLLRKQKKENKDLLCYSGFFVAENCFVIGYGLDYNGYYRNLNGVYELEEFDIARTG